MQQDTLTRRAEILRLEGNGMSMLEIVKALSEKFQCAERTIYQDFEERDVWQPRILQMKRALLKVINRHEELYRKAVFQYTQATDLRDKLAALNLIRSINVDAFMFMTRAGGQEQLDEIREKVKVGSDLNELLKQYEDSIKHGTERDFQAYRASEQVDNTSSNAEAS